MPRAGIEPTIPVFERTKATQALDALYWLRLVVYLFVQYMSAYVLWSKVRDRIYISYVLCLFF
jgi:hypothetical protein